MNERMVAQHGYTMWVRGSWKRYAAVAGADIAHVDIDIVAVTVAVADYSADNDYSNSKPCISTEQIPVSDIA